MIMIIIIIIVAVVVVVVVVVVVLLLLILIIIITTIIMILLRLILNHFKVRGSHPRITARRDLDMPFDTLKAPRVQPQFVQIELSKTDRVSE